MEEYSVGCTDNTKVVCFIKKVNPSMDKPPVEFSSG